MKYMHRQTAEVAISAELDDKFKTYLLTMEDGKTKNVSSSTFKRWWKKIQDDQVEQEYINDVMKQKEDLGIECPEIKSFDVVQENLREETVVDKNTEEILFTADDVKAVKELSDEEYAKIGLEIAAQAEEKAQLTKKSKIKKSPVKENPDVTALLDYIYSKVAELGAEIFVPSNEQLKFRSFKVGGHIAIKFNYSARNVVIGCRPVAVQDLSLVPTSKVNHIFGSCFKFTEFNERTCKDIDLLLVSCFEHQKNINANKEEKKNGKI